MVSPAPRSALVLGKAISSAVRGLSQAVVVYLLALALGIGSASTLSELPGMEEKDVEVTLSEGVLTIRGEKKIDHEEKGKGFHMVERSYGSFSRSLELPAGIDPETIKATLEKGVLTVSIPKRAADVKKVEVKEKKELKTAA